MSDPLEAQLDAIFSTLEERRQVEAAAAARKQDRREMFAASFSALKSSVIRPSFDHVAALVRARGYECRVVDSDETGIVEASSIAFSLPVPSVGLPPYFKVTCDEINERVTFSWNTVVPERGGQHGAAGHAELSAITAELMKRRAVELVRMVYGDR